MKEVSACASDFADDAIAHFKRDTIALVAEKIAWQAIANAFITLVAEKEAKNKRNVTELLGTAQLQAKAVEVIECVATGRAAKTLVKDIFEAERAALSKLCWEKRKPPFRLATFTKVSL